ncbi:GNAT family N-acetyltransferase [Roseibium algae]|uniref:GNAT family N-acetyltransferase n=1 Tax=Roseibium algae TaxID=3123038 RepID=A0ABU8TKP2_9HYPH
MSIQVRRAVAGEAEAMTDLCLRSKQSNGYDDDFMALCVDELSVTSERVSKEFFIVAEHDSSALAGCASLAVKAGREGGEVKTFFVDPEWKRQGVGSLLWAEVVAQALSMKLEKLYLDADPSAVPFYQNLGFQTVGESPSGSIPGRVIPHMILTGDALMQVEKQ